MFRTGDKAKLELILKYIKDIKDIVKNHDTEELTISSTEGEYAVLMCIVQMGEVVNKIVEQNIKDRLPASKIIGMRNKIVHGYEEVDRKIIIEVLKRHIPELEKTVIDIFREESLQ